MKIENKITEKLQGKADYDVNTLLREAREEIIRLREKVSEAGWAVDYYAAERDSLEAQLRW